MFKKKKQVKENFDVGKLNLDKPDYEIKLVGDVPQTNAQAINDRKETIAKIEQDFKNKNEITNEFIKDEVKQPMEIRESYTPEKAKQVAEELSEDLDNFIDEVEKNTFSDSQISSIAQVSDMLYKFSQDELKETVDMQNEQLGEAIPAIAAAAITAAATGAGSRLVDKIFGESANDEQKLYRKAENVADVLDLLIADMGAVEDIEGYITKDEFEVLNKACEILQDFAMMYSHIENKEDLSEATQVEEPKKRVRSKNRSKEDKMYSSDDLFLQVYDDLSSEVDNEGPKGEINKQVKVPRGTRYMGPYPGPGDYDLTVYGKSPEDFESAQKIADHYGIHMDIKKSPNNFGRSKEYPYSAILRDIK